MAKSSKKSKQKPEPAAYRHGEKRTNIPPARIAGEGKIPGGHFSTSLSSRVDISAWRSRQ